MSEPGNVHVRDNPSELRSELRVNGDLAGEAWCGRFVGRMSIAGLEAGWETSLLRIR
jgi:hypothetical protein